LTNLIILCQEYKSWSSSLCSFLQPSLTHLSLVQIILFSNTLSPCSSLNVRDQVLHSYRASEKDSRQEDKRIWTEW
jgi:hypothetical protein